MKKITDLIIQPIFVLSLCIIILCGVANIKRFEYKPVTYYEPIQIKVVKPNYVDKKYIKREVDKLFPHCRYILKYRNMDGNISGYTYLMLKLVYIDNDLTCEDFALTLTHELTHIYYYTADERYVSFKTFEILYESKNEYFKNVALAYANLQLRGAYESEYDCGGYIQEYLFGK